MGPNAFGDALKIQSEFLEGASNIAFRNRYNAYKLHTPDFCSSSVGTFGGLAPPPPPIAKKLATLYCPPPGPLPTIKTQSSGPISTWWGIVGEGELSGYDRNLYCIILEFSGYMSGIETYSKTPGRVKTPSGKGPFGVRLNSGSTMTPSSINLPLRNVFVLSAI